MNLSWIMPADRAQIVANWMADRFGTEVRVTNDSVNPRVEVFWREKIIASGTDWRRVYSLAVDYIMGVRDAERFDPCI